MPLHNFMLQDILGSLLAAAAFAAILYAPGYLVGYVTNVFEFRTMTFAGRSTWAIAYSFCVAPIVAYFGGRYVGLNFICWMFVVSAFVALFLIIRKRDFGMWSRGDKVATVLLAGAWIVFVMLMLVDLEVGHKLYFSVVMADQSYRIAFTDSVVRSGIPPTNPLYFAGAPAPMHYYYFWYVLCGVVAKIAHVTSRQAFIASSIWAGFGLLVTVHFYTQHFFYWKHKQRWIAITLLAITGADLLPALGNALFQSSLNGDIEWWSVDPIDAWPDSLLWVPHHVAGVLCCLFCFLLLWRISDNVDRRTQLWAVFLAALAFASSFGLSIYVAFGFALLMLAWLLRLALIQYPDRHARWMRAVAVGLLSALLLAPFILELANGIPRRAPNRLGSTIHLFSFSVRRMIDSGLLTGLPVFYSWNQAHPVLLDQAMRLVLLLPGLAMELGLSGAVLVLLLNNNSRQEPDEARDTALFFTISGLILTVFVSSSYITNNDFGYRAVMLPQFFLLLLTADALGSWRGSSQKPPFTASPFQRSLLYGLFCIGVAGSVYGAVLLRAWLPIEARTSKTEFGHAPQDAFEVREAFARLDVLAPKNAVIAVPTADLSIHQKEEVVSPDEFYQRMLVMDSNRQILNAEWKCAVQFGGDPDACLEIRNATTRLYASPAPSVEWTNNFCDRFGVQYLVIGHRDADWDSKTGWPASLTVIASEQGFRIYRCGGPKIQ